MSKNYINNKKLYEVMTVYYNDYQKAKANGTELPKVPEYVGECFILIANRLASKPNFSGYTFKEDMISDGIENCIAYIYNFDPNKSKNAFAYFTQFIKNAFIRRIEKEQKQQYLKMKNYQNSMLFDALTNPDNIDIKSDDVSFDIIEKYERKRLTSKKKSNTIQNTVTTFFQSNEE